MHSPQFVLAFAYLWHMLALPSLMVGIVCFEIGMFLDKIIQRRKLESGKPVVVETAAEDFGEEGIAIPPVSRRQFLVGAAIIVPPAVTSFATGYGLTKIHDFRIRHTDIVLPTLPKGLDGLKIAQVTDVHAGQFTQRVMLEKIADATNRLNPDLILMTGDLIDFHLKDLPGALKMVKSLEARHGVYLCQGNHDLFMSREGFDTEAYSKDVKLLVNSGETLVVNNEKLQILGLRWGLPEIIGHGGHFIKDNMSILNQSRDPDAFPILLAHHPHAFDDAVEAGIPLTLAGHTHGGQLMVTPGFGPASYMYKYISGLYEQGDKKLFVSNGAGNWFPLRLSAPAEIVQITLRSGMA